MKKMLLASSLIIATMSMAGEIAPTQEITLPNGEKRIIYLNGTDRYTPVDDTIDKDYIKEKAEDNTWRQKKKETTIITSVTGGAGAIIGGMAGAGVGIEVGDPIDGALSGAKAGLSIGSSIGGVIAKINNNHIQKKEEEKLTNDRKKQIEKDKKDAKEYDKENRKKKN